MKMVSALETKEQQDEGNNAADKEELAQARVFLTGVREKLDGQVAESSEVLVQDEEEIKREEEVMGSSQLGNLRQLARQTLADTKREVSAMNDEARAGTKDILKEQSESIQAMDKEKIEDLKKALVVDTA